MKLPKAPWWHEYFRKVETTELDHVGLGAALRKRRKAQNASLREVARRMGFSAPYLSDLELGRRNWSAGTITSYELALAGVEAQQKLTLLQKHIKHGKIEGNLHIGAPSHE